MDTLSTFNPRHATDLGGILEGLIGGVQAGYDIQEGRPFVYVQGSGGRRWEARADTWDEALETLGTQVSEG